MHALELSLFGQPYVRFHGVDLAGLDRGKVTRLLCYLLLYRDRPHSREILADLFWGDCTTAQSKKYLRQALWQLNNALGEAAGLLLLAEGDWVQINPTVSGELDVDRLESVYQQVRGVAGRDLRPEQADAIRQVLPLYRGDLLEGWCDEWCLYERERLQHSYLALLDKLMGFCEAHGRYEEGVHYGTLILRHDRAHERTHRRLMRLHVLNHDRTAALRQYAQCVTALREELDVEPARQTQALYERISADRPARDLAANRPVPAIAPRPAPRRHETGTSLIGNLPELLNHLKAYQRMLDQLQRQLNQDIENVEQAIEHRPHAKANGSQTY